MRMFRIVCMAAMLLCLATAAQAHRVNVFAWVEGNEVYVESEFSRGNPVKGGTVEVHNNETGDVLLTGETTDDGEFVFMLPSSALQNPVDLDVVIKAGQGHQSSWTVRAQDYADLETNDAAPAQVDNAAAQDSTAQTTAANPDTAPNAAPDTTLDTATIAALESRLEQAVDKKLDEKLTPLVRAVNRMQEDAGPSMADVFGGIGYIIGLAGLVAYFKSRKQ